MRVLIAFVALAALLAVAQADDLYNCASSKTFTIADDSETFGCDGYKDKVTVVWKLTSEKPRKLSFPKMDTESGRDVVTIIGAGIKKSFSGSSTPAPFLVPPGLITVTFKTDGSVQKTGFTIKMETGPTITELVSGHEITASEAQPGGFVYFILRGCGRGTKINVDMHVHEYQGLKPPGLFMNRNEFPTLEQGSSGWSNTSAERQSDGSYVASIELKVDSSRNSKIDDYLVGVFMYGTSTAVSVKAHWTFSTSLNTVIDSGETVESSTSSSKYYQILQVPKGAGALNIATSREVPGGMFVVYISQGRLPSESDHDYVLDTRISAYQTVTINNPNPSDNHSANPGNYLLKVQSVGSGTAGYLLMATWDNAKQLEVVEMDLPGNN